MNVQELDKNITEQEVLKALTGLSRCKSGGLDDLINEMLMDSKYNYYHILPKYLIIYLITVYILRTG